MKFEATVLLSGKTATGVEVPEEIVAALGGGKRPPVSVTLNDYTYRSTVAPMGGRFMLGINADVRAAAGVSAGDRLEIDLKLDTEPRELNIPTELVRALDHDTIAKKQFERLSYSKKQRYTIPIEKAKTDATRHRLVEKAVRELRELKSN